MKRFANQCSLKGFGIVEQQKLQQGSVLVIGVGGLGCPLIQTLCAVGIGKIGMVDGDEVNVSNLNRQFLFGISDVGQLKTSVAARKLTEMYTDLEIVEYPEFANLENLVGWIAEYDLVVDCTDNFEIRYLVSDVCKQYSKPLVMGAVFEYEAQIFAFTCRKFFSVSNFYRDVFPEMPKPNEVPTCNESGVLGALTGIVGNMMAYECIQYFVSVVAHNKLINYNMKNGEMYQLSILPKL